MSNIRLASRAIIRPPISARPGTPEPPVEQIFNSGAGITQARCDLYGQNQSFSGFTPTAASGGGPPPAATWARAFSNNEAAGTDWGWPGAADTTTGGSDNRMSCRRRYVETDTTYITDYTSSGWSYEPESVNVSQFKLGNPVAIATSNNGRTDVAGLYDPLETAALGIGTSTTTVSWNGCIEERDTVNTINASSGYSIPTAAYDLQINLIPTDDATRWKPRFPQITYYRTAYNNMTANTTTSGQLVDSATPNALQYNACPSAAQRLTGMTRGDMQSYVNGLVANGYTYHDIGMIWGARLASNGGIFADSVDTYNGMPVSRHIIFMTDGDMNPTTPSYGAYGIEGMQKRVLGTASTSEHEARHNQRFKMICNAGQGDEHLDLGDRLRTGADAGGNRMREQRQPGLDDRQPDRSDRQVHRDRQQYRRSEADAMSGLIGFFFPARSESTHGSSLRMRGGGTGPHPRPASQ